MFSFPFATGNQQASRQEGLAKGIGNVLYAPCMGLACIPITAWRTSVPPRAANIWKHSQSKHNLGQVPDQKQNKSGSPGSQQKEVHWDMQGTHLWCLCSSLCCGMGVLWGEDIHLSADPMLSVFAILMDPLFSAKDLSLGCFPSVLKKDFMSQFETQAFIFSSLLKLVSCFPGSGFPVHPGCHETAHSHTETWTGTSAPRRSLYFLTPMLSHGPPSGTFFRQWKELSTCQRTIQAMHFTHWPDAL